MQDRQALTAQQAALRLGKQPRTVYELMQRGRLGCVRRGRRVYTTEDALAAYARGQLVVPQPTPPPAGAPGGPEGLPAHLREGWWAIHREGLRLPPDVQAYLLQHFRRHLEEAQGVHEGLAPGGLPAPRSA